jgi:hypothetical protein
MRHLAAVGAVLAVGALVAGCGGDGAGGSQPRVSGPTALKLADSDQGGRPLRATLSGAAEVNNAGVPNQGDLDGTGAATVTLNEGQGQVCWEITVANIVTPTRGHIHRAPAGQNGPIVVEFFETGQPVALSGCRTVDAALIRGIRQGPQGFYVNVHNSPFPAGAVRGQLAK